MLKNKKKGFSMIELIVVIAVMVVLLAVLAPALLSYTEQSRMQKDESAMGEVTNAVHLAMADADTFDEVFSYSIPNNYLTYTDSSGSYGQKIVDEEFWAPDGSGHAVTITFNPDKNGNYDLAKGVVNDMTLGNGSVAEQRTAEGVKQCTLEEMGNQKLYAALKQAIGNSFSEKSATYKNSSYTLFIKFNLVDGTYKADVYGYFNGTNLSEDSFASVGSGTSDYTPEGEAIVTKPTGGTQAPIFSSSDLSGSGSISNPGNNTNTPDFVFYIDGVEYKAENNMTWNRWCASAYNTGGYLSLGNVRLIHYNESTKIISTIYYMDTNGNTVKMVDVNSNDIIIEGYQYAHLTTVSSAPPLVLRASDNEFMRPSTAGLSTYEDIANALKTGQILAAITEAGIFTSYEECVVTINVYVEENGVLQSTPFTAQSNILTGKISLTLNNTPETAKWYLADSDHKATGEVLATGASITYNTTNAVDFVVVIGSSGGNAPTLNKYGFYYDQPYKGQFGGDAVVVFFRESDTFDMILTDYLEVLSGTYTVNQNTISLNTIIGPATGTIVPNGTDIYIAELDSTFKVEIEDKSIWMDDEYIYLYNTELNGYVVSSVINKSKSTYKAIPSNVNGAPVVSIVAAFSECRSMSTAPTIPNSVKIIGESAFMECKNLVNITLPNSITEISDFAFYGCINLETIVIPDDVKSIGLAAFGSGAIVNDTKLKNVIFSENSKLEVIKDQCFAGCEDITSITLPKSLKAIEYDAFWDCDNLAEVKFMGTVEEWNNVNTTPSISPGNVWYRGTLVTEVICINGTVSLR